MSLNESIVENAALEWFGELGYAVGHGPHLAPGEPAAERDEASREVLRVGTPSLTQANRAFHRMLRDGVPVEYPQPEWQHRGRPCAAGGFRRCAGERLAGGTDWQEWEIPRALTAEIAELKKASADPSLRSLRLKEWWAARITRQEEIDKSIAAKAEFEYLYPPGCGLAVFPVA